MPTLEVSDASRPDIRQTCPIAIVGGGLGGLALAIGLLKHGIKVHIYEAASAYSEIGAGVTFGVNSVEALQLIDSGLLEGYKKHATFNANRDRDSTFMTVRWGMDEKRPNGRKAGDLIWHMEDEWHPERAAALGVRTRSSIHRASLLQELVSLIPEGTTSFRKCFQSVQELADGKLMLQFTDGTTTLASALIGCDGIRSKIRNLVCPDVHATYAGECAYRAMVPRADAETALGADLALNGHIYAGYGGYIVTYPVENGDFVNINAMIYDPDGNPEWDQGDWTVPITKDEILQRFRGRWYAPIVDLLSRFHLPTKWALFCVRHNCPYYKGHICLLGDSAHATTPHLGAGAGMAMEDAYVLSSLIASLDNMENIESAFRAYDAVRRPRTQGVIACSVDAGIKYSFLNPDIRDDTTALKEQLKESHRWLWHEDLEAELQEAKEILKHLDTSQ